MTIPKTRREAAREATYAEIKQIARQQMAEKGASALSLNAIAREMRMTTPALYRYFANRDALVTELVVEAFQSLGDVLETAVSSQDHTQYHARFIDMCNAYRSWAMAHPQDYTLIYGTPIPNYHAPRERTVEVASRVLSLFGGLFGEAYQAEKLTIPTAYQQLTPQMQQIIEMVFGEVPTGDQPISLFILTLLVWSRLNAVVWSTLYNHFPPVITDSGELFQLEVTAICHELSLGK